MIHSVSQLTLLREHARVGGSFPEHGMSEMHASSRRRRGEPAQLLGERND
jgi:hypothetical protein